MNENKKWYQSSTGTGDLALTVKGALVAFVPLVLMVLNSQGVSITQSDLMDMINTFFTALSAVMVFWGLARKVYYSFTNK